MNAYEQGQEMGAKKEARARDTERFGMEKQKFSTDEEAAKQHMEQVAAQLAEAKEMADERQHKRDFLGQTDEKTGQTFQERDWRAPFEKADLDKRVSEENIAGAKADRTLRGQEFDLTKTQDARAVAAAKSAKENENLAAQVGAKIMATPTENMDQAAAQIMAQVPPQQQAAAFKAIGDARAQKFSQTLANNSTPEGQLKVQLHKQAYTALTDANELRGKLTTFMNNKDAGGLDVGIGEIPTQWAGLGMRNDTAKNSLQEIASIISRDNTPQAQELAKKMTSPYRMDDSVISEVNAYINGKERETKNLVERNKNFFPAGEKDEFQKSLMHLTQGIGGDKNRPTSKGLTGQQAGAFLTGFPANAPEQQYQVQPVSTGVGDVPQQGAPPQGMPPMQPSQASPMPAPPQVSPLRQKYGKQH